jgi:integrase
MNRAGGSLKFATVADSTRKRYTRAVIRFRRWAARRGLTVCSPEELDILLEEYFDDWFYSGGGVAGARNVYYGACFLHPELAGSMPRSARALKGMAKLLPSVSWPPLTWELAVCIAANISSNTSLPAHERDAGLAVLVHFDGFLRTGEVLDLRARDFAEPTDARVGVVSAFAALRIRSAKTGPNQFAQLHDPDVIAMVSQRASSLPAESRLFQLSPARYRLIFKEALHNLGLTANYVPHSLRHGAATRAMMHGVSIEEIMRRGRWASSKSVRTYIQQGQALLLANEVPLSLHRRGCRLASSLSRAISIARSFT